MTRVSRDLERAKADALAARQHLAATMSEIQERLNPRVLLREAWAELRERGDQAAGDALEAMKNRPAATAGAAAAVGLLLLRHPLGRAAAKFFAHDETETPDDKLTAVKSKAPARPRRRRTPISEGD